MKGHRQLLAKVVRPGPALSRCEWEGDLGLTPLLPGTSSSLEIPLPQTHRRILRIHMNSCRRYRADTADNEAVVAPSQSTVWPIVSADTDLPSQERSTKESRLTPISWSLARGSYWSSPDFSVFDC